MPTPEPESNPLCGADPLARALARLQPAPAGVDGQKLLFLAGQAARDRTVAVWQRLFLGQTVVLVAVGCAAALLFARLDAIDTPDQSPNKAGVWPPLPAPVARDMPPPGPQEPPEEPSSPPAAPAVYTKSEAKPDDLADYLRTRREVLTAGLGLLPDTKPQPAAPVSPAELERSLYLPPGVLAAPYRAGTEEDPGEAGVTRMRYTVPTLLLLAAAAYAQPPAAVKKLTVTAVGEPTPALRFTLLPSLMDRTPGNAALEYHRAFAAFPSGLSAAERSKAEEKAAEWMKESPDKSPPPEVKKLLDDFGAALRHADRAARCDRCDWELDARIRTDILGTTTHEIGPIRDLGRYTALRARAEIAAGNYGDAAQSLRTGFQMARHTAEVPMLIHLLVAATMAQDQLDAVEAWVARPGSPNLYWALAGLPRPFLDFRRSIEAEAGFPDTITWLGLKPLEQGPVTKEQAEKVVGGWIRNVIKSATPDELKQFGLEGPVGDVAVTTVLTLRYAAAKKYLLAQGKPTKDVEAMPAAQVVYLYDLALFRELRDDQFKWFSLPYPEAHAGLRKAAERRQKVLAVNWNAPVLKTLALSLPALDKIHLAGVRTDRAAAALRVIEAVRMQVAADGGKLPSRLDLVKLVPVPNDPVTGQPFGYDVREGNTFVLTGSPPEGETANPGNTLTYEVTVK